jgi:hypothetical protein
MQGFFMLEENIADVVLNKVRTFTVGFGRAGETPAAKGSGVLVRLGDMSGILTCAHVEDHLRKLKIPVGLVRFNRGSVEQFGMLDLEEVFSFVRGQDPWEDEDLAFIHLPPHLVGNIEKDCAFLNVEKNSTKPEPDGSTTVFGVHAVFGLVDEFTGATTREGRRATTVLRGVLTSGTLRDFNPSTAMLDCSEANIPDLPASFGGTSGGGLWRVYMRKSEDGSLEAFHHRLIGIASSEDRSTTPPRWIRCQSIGRIEALLHNVRRDLGGA